MACFDNYILVRGACGSATPSTGLYINDLPGLSLRRAANVADEEKVTGVNLLNDSISLGIELTKKEIMEKMADTVRFNSIYTHHIYGELDYDNYNVATAGNNGITSELDCDCKLLRQFIPRIDILLNTTITDKELYIIDGPTTTTYTFDSTAGGLVSIFPNYEATNETISIVMEGSDILSSKVQLSGYCMTCRSGFCNCDCDLIIRSTGSGLYGLRPTIQAICSEDAYFCQINHLMGRLAWFWAGIIFIDELLLTNRINEFTLYDIDRAQAAQQHWWDEFNNGVVDLVKRLPRFFSQTDSCCVECDSSRWVYAHP